MSFKHFELLDEVSYEELPQTIQTKLDNFEKTFQDYDDLDENDDENDDKISELELKLETMDNGLYADLEQFIQQKNQKQEVQDNKQEIVEEKKEGENSPAQQNYAKPSWRFW